LGRPAFKKSEGVVMAVTVDILTRKVTHFLLWQPGMIKSSAPHLIIGNFKPGNPPVLDNQKRLAMTPAVGLTGLWEIAASECQLSDEEVYHYWFEVEDTGSNISRSPLICCTDPMAFAVDWRLFPPDAADNRQPAAVILWKDGKLLPCDPGGDEVIFEHDVPPHKLPANNRLVIYELPTAWVMSRGLNEAYCDVGTFRDARALVDEKVGGANFADLDLLQPGRSYLSELGVNAIELLPPADSFFKRVWGYDTAHFLAPDYELGFPEGNASPTANLDLIALVRACHEHGIRIFVDMVMAFGREEAYEHIDFPNFFIAYPDEDPSDPDALTSIRGDGTRAVRNGFGSALFRYAKFVHAYDPISGQVKPIAPARQLMFTYLTRWARDFHIDGIRMDSVENVANWDFVGDFKDLGHRLFQQRWNEQESDSTKASDHFLVVGEELSLAFDLLKQRRLDALWNDAFRVYVRAAIVGENADGEPSFEWTVRKAIDCRNIGFASGLQAVNYITSHDVEQYRRERLFTMLRNFSEQEKRIKLAFVCLLTAVGIPMILAGEEFADQHDLFDEHGWVTQSGGKQIDPVKFSRLTDRGDPDEPMRRRIFNYVARLVKFRTGNEALAVDDTEFIHVDFTAGKRVLVWKRGGPSEDPVVVVANFSDFVTTNASSPGAEYRVSNWPLTPPGRQWREVTQERFVPQEYVGREPIFPWEAKVYALAYAACT
jgi:pullulanase